MQSIVDLFLQDGESDAPAPDWGELSDAPGDSVLAWELGELGKSENL